MAHKVTQRFTAMTYGVISVYPNLHDDSPKTVFKKENSVISL